MIYVKRSSEMSSLKRHKSIELIAFVEVNAIFNNIYSSQRHFIEWFWVFNFFAFCFCNTALNHSGEFIYHSPWTMRNNYLRSFDIFWFILIVWGENLHICSWTLHIASQRESIRDLHAICICCEKCFTFDCSQLHCATYSRKVI